MQDIEGVNGLSEAICGTLAENFQGCRFRRYVVSRPVYTPALLAECARFPRGLTCPFPFPRTFKPIANHGLIHKTKAALLWLNDKGNPILLI
jgi:hypothetical protein